MDEVKVLPPAPPSVYMTQPGARVMAGLLQNWPTVMTDEDDEDE
jgi:hypothetical protein